jgi:VanZ family protein
LTKFNDYWLVRVVGVDALPQKGWSPPPSEVGTPLAALLERTSPEILAVALEQVERIEMAAIDERFSVLLRAAVWLSVLGLLVASWTPGQYMIRTGARGSFEHVGAYLMTTLLLVFAYPRSPPWIVGGALAIYAGILEVGQLYIPGRHSQFEDFAASCLGIALVILPRIWIRWAHARPQP